jgi:hypothetical protein
MRGFCRPFDPKKEETQAARMADWFYVVGLSQNEEISVVTLGAFTDSLLS